MTPVTAATDVAQDVAQDVTKELTSFQRYTSGLLDNLLNKGTTIVIVIILFKAAEEYCFPPCHIIRGRNPVCFPGRFLPDRRLRSRLRFRC